MTELSTRFNFRDIESKWCQSWEGQGVFHAVAHPEKPAYSVVIPPPNVTGILHMGHALNNTLQDIIVRYKRMRGYEACWMPGTDHAGIATQNVVEKELGKQGKSRHSIGREEMLKRLWAWKEQYGDTIINQLKRLGASCDWPRTRFTMDEGYSQAVREVFVRLYEKGLIYQGQYIINWCPRCQTALSDEEAEHRDLNGSLYYIKYPYKDRADEYMLVATTRPETMLGDTAVAVHPEDKRYKKSIGKTLVLPLLNREIKVIADELVHPEFGTGAVKVTPAHDPNDFQMGQRHGLEFINIMQPDAVLNEQAGPYKGLDRFVARKKIVEALKESGLLLKIEPHQHAVGHCYRCHTVVEPYLSKQWFVSMKPLAEPAIRAVTDGKIKFYPDRWTKVYLNWMENIRDWCISRQIWWGHQIPVWSKRVHLTEENWNKELLDWGWDSYLEGKIAEPHVPIVIKIFRIKDGREISPKEDPLMPVVPETEGEYEIFVCTSSAAEGKEFEQYGFRQDPDVLDTWFSSWLWPFATFGWPQLQKSAAPKKGALNDLDYFYPTNALFTASEIIFFWVARMIMAGLEFMGDIPFSDVYIHGTVRDTGGRKMSKSLGNAIDPLEIIEEYGADALRFSLIINSGQDLFISKEKFEVGRNFANKIWNASRLILMNVVPENRGSGIAEELSRSRSALDLPARWILSRFAGALRDMNAAIEGYRFSEAENIIYEFFWRTFCDWYLEISKDQFSDPRVQKLSFFILEQSVRIMHPFMPFVTEEIWTHLGISPEGLARQPWPGGQEDWIDPHTEKQMQGLIDVVTAIRNIKMLWNIKPQQAVDCFLSSSRPQDRRLLEENVTIIQSLAKVNQCAVSAETPSVKEAAVGLAGQITLAVPLRGLVDIEKERRRILTEIERERKNHQQLSQRLSNRAFLDKAPQDVVEKEKGRLSTIAGKVQELQQVLENFKLS